MKEVGAKDVHTHTSVFLDLVDSFSNQKCIQGRKLSFYLKKREMQSLAAAIKGEETA